MRIKFITLTCEKYHNTRVSNIRKTWGKNQDITFLSDIIVGDDIIGYDYLQKGYENVWMKYSEFLRINDSFEHDWYFFTDDDTFVNTKNVYTLLKKYNSYDSICIGHMGAIHSDGKDMNGQYTGFPINTISGKDTHLPLYYVSGGAGFILSNKSMKQISAYIKGLENHEIPKSYNGDVTFGFWIRNSKIEIKDIIGFWWTNPTELKHHSSEIKSSYTYHYVNESEMLELYNLSNSFTIVTQIRNEEKRLSDWIKYHKKIGIDEFIIYLDNCTDKSRDILEELSKDINIKIRDANMFGSYPDSDNPNTYSAFSVVMRIKDSYKRGLREVRDSNVGNNHWTIFTEVDEYIVPQQEDSLSDIVSRVFGNRIYIASYDFKCPFDLDYPVYNQTFMRWSDVTRQSGTAHGVSGWFKNRGKSLVRTNFVLSDDVDIHDVDFSDFWQDDNLLKINHYRNNGEMQVYDHEDKKILNWI